MKTTKTDGFKKLEAAMDNAIEKLSGLKSAPSLKNELYRLFEASNQIAQYAAGLLVHAHVLDSDVKAIQAKIDRAQKTLDRINAMTD